MFSVSSAGVMNVCSVWTKHDKINSLNVNNHLWEMNIENDWEINVENIVNWFFLQYAILWVQKDVLEKARVILPFAFLFSWQGYLAVPRNVVPVGPRTSLPGHSSSSTTNMSRSCVAMAAVGPSPTVTVALRHNRKPYICYMLTIV